MKVLILIIYNVIDDTFEGTLCISNKTKEIAYSTESQELSNVLDFILDRDLYSYNSEKISKANFIIEEKVNHLIDNYIISLSYSLPLPWSIIDIYSEDGDIEELSKRYYDIFIKSRGVKNE